MSSSAVDRRLEATVGWILRLGVLTSSLCLATGLGMTLAGRGSDLAQFLLAAGIVALIATPAARVLASVIVYARERDWVFVGLTLVVLAELVASLLVARGARSG